MAGRVIILDQLALLQQRAVEVIGIAGRCIGRAATEGHILTLVFQIDDQDVFDCAGWRGGTDVAVFSVGVGGQRQQHGDQ